MSTAPLKPDQIPVSPDSSLSPTKAYYLLHHKHTTSILSLTPHLSSLYSPSTGLSLATASNLATSSGEPFPPVVYTLKKENIFGTHMTVKDDKGIEIADWKSPILSLHMGMTKITFLHPDQHSDTSSRGEDENGNEGELSTVPSGVESPEHNYKEVKGEMVQVRPAGVGRRAEEFEERRASVYLGSGEASP